MMLGDIMRNFDDLLQKAKFGELTDYEIKRVVENIKASTPENDWDLYTLIHILGKGGGPKYKTIVEPFLYYPSFPLISGIALRTLTFWSLGQEYLTQLKAFLRGVEWDIEDDVRLSAIGCAGIVLLTAKEKDMEIIQILDDLVSNEANEVLKEAVFESLALAVGKEWNEILYRTDPKFAQSVLELTQKLLNKGKMQG